MKLLINENANEAQSLTASIQQIMIPCINRVSAEYRLMNLGEITHSIILDLINDQGAQLRQTLFEQLDLELAKVKNLHLRKSMRESVKFDNIAVLAMSELIPIIRYRDYLTLLTIENGEASLSNEAVEAIQEACRVYLADPQEIALYKAHHAATEALNELAKVSNRRQIVLTDFFRAVENNMFVSNGINYTMFKK